MLFRVQRYKEIMVNGKGLKVKVEKDEKKMKKLVLKDRIGCQPYRN